MSSDPHRVPTSCMPGPAVLVALALTLFLGWQLWAGLRQYQSAGQVWDQQEVTARQAAEAKRKFEAMMMELIELAETHAEARRIIRKYNVKFTPEPPASEPLSAEASAVTEESPESPPESSPGG